MKVDLRMSNDDHFSVSSWWAEKPEFVINSLRQQLEAATSVWPELAAYRIDKKRIRRPSTDTGRVT